ncbi:argininosuccinate lyase [Paenibacillus popilliae]|uniref:argininosuccinate lyase n=1 Tax=Paenibacillus popilliae ATCC 14706 TaxID=1212764 RepID=M9LMB7_PAEPP|nr:lyase family protein [Paenibacillus popilliae]GAC44500.1 argininosuccinate lyase [Paenibacillus popilliae ATCC 14706]
MNLFNELGQSAITGRLLEQPSTFIHDEILHPQFTYEVEHLLPYYLRIEKVISMEYARMGLLDMEALQAIILQLDQIDIETLVGNPQANMTDILFAIERYVEQNTSHSMTAWHLDRSRNDVQATAQVMLARDKLLEIIEAFLLLSDAMHPLAQEHVHVRMPGYTHYQSAQIISVGFYFTAMNEQIGHTIDRLHSQWMSMDTCPLGSGAMSGLELPWDRMRMAQMLGFTRYCRHALMGVASKEFMLLIGAELSTASVALTRFVTDFMNWGSSEYRFMDLPDHLCGISSAMPQKKNFTVLERIRGKLAHIPAYYIDLVMGQQRTPYTNMVETAKEGGSNLLTMLATMQTAVQLLTYVISHMRFDREQMERLCTKEFFGGFSLANQLTLRFDIPYRKAQIVAGKYITAMMDQGRLPADVDPHLLQELCRELGYPAEIQADVLIRCFSAESGLTIKKSLGSTHPDQVAALLSIQERERTLRWKDLHKKQEQSRTYLLC